MKSKIEFLESIKPNMRLTKNFFLNLYAYGLDGDLEFKEVCLKKLKEAGCLKAEEYYEMIVGEYERKYQEEMKEVCMWYRRWKRKEGEKKRVWNRKKTIECLQKKSDKELLNLLQELNKNFG